MRNGLVESGFSSWSRYLMGGILERWYHSADKLREIAAEATKAVVFSQ